MKVILTDILDTNIITDDNASKILFANDLIEDFAPMFHEELRKKQEQFSSNVADVKKLKNVISGYKQPLLNVKNAFEVESLKNKVLREIAVLNDTDVMYGKTRSLVQNILTSIDSQLVIDLKKNLNLLQRLTKELRNMKKG